MGSQKPPTGRRGVWVVIRESDITHIQPWCVHVRHSFSLTYRRSKSSARISYPMAVSSGSMGGSGSNRVAGPAWANSWKRSSHWT